MTDASDNTNALEMSDEEFAELNFDDLPDDVPEETEDKEEEVISNNEEITESITEEEHSEDTAEEEVAEETSEEEEISEDSEEAIASEEDEEDVEDKESEDTEVENEDTTETSEEEDSTDTEDEETKTASEINYEEAYKKITSPFKANGKDIQVDNIDDAITLMQMGANYNKKMAGLKPNLKLLKMLENNDLLTEEKLTYLIDLDKKDPNAVTKLIKDSGVDLLNIDTETPNEYVPNTYTVNDQEVELDGILDEIRDTDSFNTTLDIIGNKWDKASQQLLIENPSVIKTLNDQVESGIFQQIKHVMDNERMLGRLSGLSDLEAYKQVGDAIDAQGGFDTPSDTLQQTVAKAKKKAADPNLKSRKKAASVTKSTSNVKQKESYDPLSMSDEEFEKVSMGKFI